MDELREMPVRLVVVSEIFNFSSTVVAVSTVAVHAVCAAWLTVSVTAYFSSICLAVSTTLSAKFLPAARKLLKKPVKASLGEVGRWDELVEPWGEAEGLGSAGRALMLMWFPSTRALLRRQAVEAEASPSNLITASWVPFSLNLQFEVTLSINLAYAE